MRATSLQEAQYRNLLFELKMWGSRNPCNILLESDCSLHEPRDDGQSNQQLYISPQNDRYCRAGYGTPDLASDLLHRNSRRTCATPDEFSGRKSFSDRGARTAAYGEQFSQRSPASDNHSTPTRSTEYGEQFTRGTVNDIHTKSVRPADYREQFRQGIVDNIHTNSGRPADVDNYSRRVIEDAWSKSNEHKCSRETSRGTSFSCHDCKEPQCLYCWRKWRDTGGDFSFLDGFETQEPAWKPGRKIVDQLNDCYAERKRSTMVEDQLHPQNHKWKSSACLSSCSQEEPKWKPANFHESSGGHETNNEQHSKKSDSSFKENERQWPLGKGRGIGPVPAEWLPPFRKHSSFAEHPLPPFQRSRGVGALPNLEDWVPPFRGDEQPYNWHRRKGSGGCPPRDQWLAPWCDSNEKERADRVYGGRRDGHCSEYPDGHRFWSGETREIFETCEAKA